MRLIIFFLLVFNLTGCGPNDTKSTESVDVPSPPPQTYHCSQSFVDQYQKTTIAYAEWNSWNRRVDDHDMSKSCEALRAETVTGKEGCQMECSKIKGEAATNFCAKSQGKIWTAKAVLVDCDDFRARIRTKDI